MVKGIIAGFILGCLAGVITPKFASTVGNATVNVGKQVAAVGASAVNEATDGVKKITNEVAK